MLLKSKNFVWVFRLQQLLAGIKTLDGSRVRRNLFIILVILLIIGCSRNYNSKNRILELRQFSKKEVNSKSMQGGLIFGIGGFSSSENQELYVHTMVQAESGFQYFKIPLSKIRINIDNKLEYPFLEMNVHFNATHYSS